MRTAIKVLTLALLVLASSCVHQHPFPTVDQYGVRSVGYALGQWPMEWLGQVGNEFCLRLTFAPSFHPECALTIRQGDESCEVEVVAFTQQLYPYITCEEWGRAPDQERPRRPTVRRAVGHLTDTAAREFRQALAEIRPLSMNHQPHHGCDGIDIRCEYVSGQNFNDFVFGTPAFLDDPRYASLPRVALQNSYASDLPQWAIDLLERVEGYISSDFPCREVSGAPRVFRLYGSLTHCDEWMPHWDSFFAELGHADPVLVDLRNVESVAPAWEPMFAGHHAPRHSYWVISPGARPIVEWLRVADNRTFWSIDEAVRAMTAGH
ncbi:MAG: hypothetical protein A3K18_17345 [Lentisphaerae bacterium RIFOXYA12_64_32]|nr:MAG: hypothetical protein A3K18_17345 [Lentisphaerae bacterium RIFOXYA12_64_32]